MASDHPEPETPLRRPGELIRPVQRLRPEPVEKPLADPGDASARPAGRQSNRSIGRTVLVLLGAGLVTAVLGPRLMRSGNQTLEAAVTAGKVRVEIQSWSPGFFRISAAKVAPGGPDRALEVPLGTTFFSLDPERQNIVVTGVRGKDGAVPQRMGSTEW